MGSVGMIEMNGIKKLNFIDVHTYKKNNFLLINKYDILLFQLLLWMINGNPYRSKTEARPKQNYKR